MRAQTALGSLVSVVGCFLFLLSIAGCGQSAEPVRTSPDSIDAFLEANPDEAYTSDGLVAEMEEDDGEG